MSMALTHHTDCTHWKTVECLDECLSKYMKTTQCHVRYLDNKKSGKERLQYISSDSGKETFYPIHFIGLRKWNILSLIYLFPPLQISTFYCILHHNEY